MTEGAESEKRYYREAQPAQAMKENDQYVLFTVPGLESLAMYYEAGQPLMVNHNKWNSVGYGQTAGASVADKVLTVQFYILRDFEPGTGPVHKSNELIKAVEDGFLKDVSVGVKIMRSECSICGNNYGNYRECRHWRGQREVVTDPETGEETIVRCIQIVHEAEATELSLVWNGSDPHAMVSDKYIDMSITEPYDTDKMQAVLTQPPAQQQAATPEPTTAQGGNTMDLETLQANLNTAEAEKQTLEIQKDALQKQCDALEASLKESQDEVKGLKADADKNAELIEAGRAARKELEDKALELFVAGKENCTEDDKTAQRTFLESLSSCDAVEGQIKAWQSIVDAKIPNGRQTVDGEQAGDPATSQPTRTTQRVRY